MEAKVISSEPALFVTFMEIRPVLKEEWSKYGYVTSEVAVELISYASAHA
jgi:hypothetical protein